MAEALDPLGEVYQGRDNTGSANIIGPKSRRSVADLFIDEVRKRGVQKAALKDAQRKMLEPGNLKAWDKDLPYMQKLRDEHTKMLIDYEQNVGKDKNADIIKYNQILDHKDMMFHAAGASEADRIKYDSFIKEALVNPNVTPDFGQKVNEWSNIPTEQRLGTDPDLKRAPVDWKTDYMKTKAVGSYTTGSEKASPDNPLENVTHEDKVFDKGKAEKKAMQWMSQMGNPQHQAYEDARSFIENDPHLKAEYDKADEKTRQHQVYNVAVQQLVDIDEALADVSHKQGLQAIPQPREGSGAKAKIKTVAELKPITETHDLSGVRDDVKGGVQKFGVEKEGGFTFPKYTIQPTDLNFYDEKTRKMDNLPGTQTIDIQDVNMYPYLKQEVTYKTKGADGKDIDKTIPQGALLGRTTIAELKKGMSKDQFDEVVGKKLYAPALLNSLSGSGKAERSIKIPYDQVRDKIEGEMTPDALTKAREIEARLLEKDLYGTAAASTGGGESKWSKYKRK